MKQDQNNNAMSMEQIMAFAKSEAGQKLIALLQQKNDPSVVTALQQATAGNMENAKTVASSLLSDPEIRNLLKQFGG